MRLERCPRTLYRSPKNSRGSGWSFTRRSPGHPRVAPENDGYSRSVIATWSLLVHNGTCEDAVAAAGSLWENRLSSSH
jgi:hypothetical protein